MRFQESFTADGGLPTDLDFTPPPAATRWAHEVAAKLVEAGIAAHVDEDTDDESDARFPTVDVAVGPRGSCQLAFWNPQVFWSVEVTSSEVDLATARQMLATVRQVVEDVTTWKFVDSIVTSAYERTLLGLPPHSR
ncbi:hypothetical protein [Cellulomonas sp. URHB0016]